MMESKFENFKRTIFLLLSENLGIDMTTMRASPYELILESELTPYCDRLKFQVIDDGGEKYLTEVRLHHRDIFAFNQWGLFLLDTDGRVDINFEEHTFVDEIYFGKEARELAGVYNSNLMLVVNNAIVMPGIRTDGFRKYIGVSDRRNQGESGLLEIEYGYPILIGSKNIHFRLELPRKMNLKDSRIRIRLRLRGLLFQNLM